MPTVENAADTAPLEGVLQCSLHNQMYMDIKKQSLQLIHGDTRHLSGYAN